MAGPRHSRPGGVRGPCPRVQLSRCLTAAAMKAILAAIAEFERARIAERVVAGLERARRQGKQLGRPMSPVPVDRLTTVRGLSLSEGAPQLGISRSTIKRWRKRVQHTSPVTV